MDRNSAAVFRLGSWPLARPLLGPGSGPAPCYPARAEVEKGAAKELKA